MKLWLLIFDIQSDVSNGFAIVSAPNPNTALLILMTQGSLNQRYNIVGIREIGVIRDCLLRILNEGITSRGEQGAKGDKGDKGDQGILGILGILGPKGDTGELGPIGPQGPKGDNGTFDLLTPELKMLLKGDKGDKGDLGIQGLQGIQGEKGEKGETGAQGPRGLLGEIGPQGPQGELGILGVKGEKGDPFSIYKTYESIALMNEDLSNVPEGKFTLIASNVEDPDNAKLFIRTTNSFKFLTDMSGAKGIQGPIGPLGILGPQGILGPIGETGPLGEQGIQGIQGILGPLGDTYTITQDDYTAIALIVEEKITIPTKVSELLNDAGYLTLHLDISGKLDTITDLATIRSGAALGASALLSLPSNAVTTNTDLTIAANKVFSKSISSNLSITWNLLIPNAISQDFQGWEPNNEAITVSISNNTALIHIGGAWLSYRRDIYEMPHGHLILVIALIKYTLYNNSIKFNVVGADKQNTYATTINTTDWQTVGVLNTPYPDNRLWCAILSVSSTGVGDIQFRNIMAFDLTLMFGAGNEPTLEEFKSMFPLNYYEYNAGSTIENALLVGSNLNAPVLYEGGLKLSDKYNKNLGYNTLEELKNALKAIW